MSYIEILSGNLDKYRLNTVQLLLTWIVGDIVERCHEKPFYFCLLAFISFFGHEKKCHVSRVTCHIAEIWSDWGNILSWVQLVWSGCMILLFTCCVYVYVNSSNFSCSQRQHSLWIRKAWERSFDFHFSTQARLLFLLCWSNHSLITNPKVWYLVKLEGIVMFVTWKLSVYTWCWQQSNLPNRSNKQVGGHCPLPVQ